MTGTPAGRPEAAEAIWNFTHDERAPVAPGRVRLRGGLQALAGVGVGLMVMAARHPRRA